MLISQILWMFGQFLMFAILGSIFLSVLFSIIYFFIYKKILKGQRRIDFKTAFVIVVFVGYMLMVLYATWFSRSPSEYYSVNLSLFSSYIGAWNSFTLRSWQLLIFNIIMFIPFGILLPLVNKKFKNMKYTALLGAIFTLLIESIQYIYNIGVFEVDDLLNNFVGVLIGYGIVMTILSIMNREKNLLKKVICYLLPLILVVAGFAGISIKYNINEFGNLGLAYSQKMNCENVQIKSDIEFSKEVEKEVVYKTNIYDKKTGLEYAKKIYEGMGIPTENLEIIQYNNEAIYKVYNDIEYSLWVEYVGGKYTFTDFSSNKYEPFEDNITRDMISAELEKMNIVLPKGLKFIDKNDNHNGKFSFEADMIKAEDKYFLGQLDGTIYEDGAIRSLNSNLIALEKYKSVDVISEYDAFEKIKQGKFKIYLEEPLSSLVVQDVEIVHRSDSKGYYQPVYKFKARINGIQRVVYIPAIAK